VTDSLKLRAVDDEDWRVLSALLQDALVALSEVKFLAKQHMLALVASRFRWENCSDIDLGGEIGLAAEPAARPGNGHGKEPTEGDAEYDAMLDGCSRYERVNCGVCFEGVETARRRGFDPAREASRILEVLAIESKPGVITITFAGGAAIRLEGRNITCRLQDLGEPWPTQSRPVHPVNEVA